MHPAHGGVVQDMQLRRQAGLLAGVHHLQLHRGILQLRQAPLQQHLTLIHDAHMVADILQLQMCIRDRFEDNAEHGLGMYIGQNKIRQDLAEETRQLIAVEWARPELKAAAQAWLDTMEDGEANAEAARAFVKALEDSICTVEELAAVPQFAEHAAELKAKGALFCDCAACTIAADLLSKKEYLAKKSMWIFGGDGWAYDLSLIHI